MRRSAAADLLKKDLAGLLLRQGGDPRRRGLTEDLVAGDQMAELVDDDLVAMQA